MLRGGSALHTDSQLRKREDATEHEDDPSAHVSTRANGYLEVKNTIHWPLELRVMCIKFRILPMVLVGCLYAQINAQR